MTMPGRTTVEAQGDRLVTTIPDAVVAGLGLYDGAELVWVDAPGGIRVLRSGGKTHRVIAAHEQVIAEHGDVFRELSDG